MLNKNPAFPPKQKRRMMLVFKNACTLAVIFLQNLRAAKIPTSAM